jgi:hypothetical protein
MQVGERLLSLTNYRTPRKMSNLKSYLWWAMPPTAFLSLASLLTYLVFRIVYLATAEQVQRKHSEDATFNRLRTLALPWIFFVLEMIILRELLSNNSSLSIHGCKTLTRSSGLQYQTPSHTSSGFLPSSQKYERNDAWLVTMFLTSTYSSPPVMRIWQWLWIP